MNSFTDLCPVAFWSRYEPELPAVRLPSETLNYATLDRAIRRLSALLLEGGVRRGVRVGFVPRSDPAGVVWFWSLFRLGAIACPVSFRLPAASREKIMHEQNLMHCFDETETRDAVLWDGGAAERNRFVDPLAMSAPATMIFSSGTTASPKAVVHDLAAHFSNAMGSADNIPLAPGDGWLLSLPLFHVGGLAIVFRCILAGASVVIADPERSLAENLAREEVTHASLVPVQLHDVLAAPDQRHGHWKGVLLGGSGWPEGMVSSARDRGIPICTTYGLTEMASQVTATPRIDVLPNDKTSGPPLAGRELALRADGEILVRGTPLCLGYAQGPSLEPVVDAEGWFSTGDLGWLEGGWLTVRGRKDAMFISGGENIHPEEIESLLLALPGIRRCLVIPVPDSRFGFRPVAVVDAEQADEKGWQAALGAHLPAYKVPRKFLAWPAEGDLGLKPSRERLRHWAERAE